MQQIVLKRRCDRVLDDAGFGGAGQAVDCCVGLIRSRSADVVVAVNHQLCIAEAGDTSGTHNVVADRGSAAQGAVLVVVSIYYSLGGSRIGGDMTVADVAGRRHELEGTLIAAEEKRHNIVVDNEVAAAGDDVVAGTGGGLTVGGHACSELQ